MTICTLRNAFNRVLLTTIALSMAVVTMTAGGAFAQDLSARDYHIETILAADGGAKAVIVSNSQIPAYRATALQLQHSIEDLCGVELPIIEADDTTSDEVLADRNAIVLGNLATSSFVKELYWQWYTMLDMWYPGEDGFVVRSLHDPYGTGNNVILLGGSEDNGVRRAARVFVDMLDEGDPLTVGRLMEIKLGDNHTVPPEGEWMDPRLRIFHEPLEHRTVHECPLGFTDASLAGLRYYYNGDKEALQRFKDLALNTDILSDQYHYYAHMHALLWDLIEESPEFSDEQRRIITGKLLEFARGPDGTEGRDRLLEEAERHAASSKLLDRHSAMSANCILTHSRYFNKYWPAEEWEKNLEAVRAYFDRPMTSAKGWRDEGNWHTYLECPVIPALLMRDERIVESGALRHVAELLLMFCDNAGNMISYGGYPGNTLRACAAVLEEPGLLATIPRREEKERASGKYPLPYGFMHGQAWDIGLESEPMEKMIGVYHRPLTRWQWEHYNKGFPFEQGMDKLTMRSGFEEDDQYLLLDGISRGGSKPLPNRNAIVALGAYGRTFLRGSSDSMLVSREGLSEMAHKIVALESTANLPTFGYSHARAVDHAFSDWDRHIFWRKGQWFVVLDEVTVREDGRYSIVGNWPMWGGVRIDGDTAIVTAGGDDDRAVMHMTPAESIRVDRDGSRVRQTQCGEMAAGENTIITNLIFFDREAVPDRFNIRKADAHTAVLSGPEQGYVGICPEGTFEKAGIVLQGHAFCLSPASLTVVQGTEMRCPGLDVAASVPCNMELQPANGRLTVEAAEPVTVTVGDTQQRFETGVHSLEVTLNADEILSDLVAAIEEDAASPRAQAPPAVPDDLAEIPVAWSSEVGGRGSWECYHVGDVNADGKDEILVGLNDGRAVCLDEGGEMLWEYATEGPVLAVSHATLEGSPVALIGSEDEHLYAVSADDQAPLWKHKCFVSEERYQAAPWWMMGYAAPVLEILPADLDGDGATEIFVGTGGGFIEAVSGGGELLWKCEFKWGLPNDLTTVPEPEGATHLLVNANNSASGSRTWRLDAAGKIVTQNALPTDRGSWDSTRVTACEVVEMNEAGDRMVVVGRGGVYAEVALHDAETGERRWKYPLAAEATSVAAADLDGDGTREVLVGSMSAWLTAFDISGELQWATFLPGGVLAVTAGAEGVFVQCTDGNIYRLLPDGEFAGMHASEAPAPPSQRNRWRFQQLGNSLIIGDETGVLRPLQVSQQ
ncbi:MAG: hypothetical protein R6V19_17700 [Armatimonadota bacterium]